MPHLTADQWSTVRAEREAGASFPDLATRFGISHQAIQKRAAKEGWADKQDVREIIRRKVAEKVAGVVAADNTKKKAEAINAAVDRRAEVIKRHQDETDHIRSLLCHGIETHKGASSKEAKQLAFEDLKAAKIASECLLNLHKAERQAWSLDDPPPDSSNDYAAHAEALRRRFGI